MEVNKNSKSYVTLKPEHVKPEDRVKFMVEELRIRIETYRSYINLVLQINVFFYLTAGAVLGFYLKNPQDKPAINHLEYFLLLPILISAVLGGIFFHGAELQEDAAKSIERIKQQLIEDPKLDIEEIPDIDLLRLLFLIFGIIFFIAGAALSIVPRISTVASLWDLVRFPGDLGVFGWVGLAVLVGGGLSTYFFLRIFSKRAKDVRTGARAQGAEQENSEVNDNSTAA